MDFSEIVDEFNEILDKYRILTKFLQQKKQPQLRQNVVNATEREILSFVHQYANLLDLEPRNKPTELEPIILSPPLAASTLLPTDTMITAPLPLATPVPNTFYMAENPTSVEAHNEDGTTTCCCIS